jgi:hypothetical protein
MGITAENPFPVESREKDKSSKQYRLSGNSGNPLKRKIIVANSRATAQRQKYEVINLKKGSSPEKDIQ